MKIYVKYGHEQLKWIDDPQGDFIAEIQDVSIRSDHCGYMQPYSHYLYKGLVLEEICFRSQHETYRYFGYATDNKKLMDDLYQKGQAAFYVSQIDAQYVETTYPEGRLPAQETCETVQINMIFPTLKELCDYLDGLS